MNHHFHAFIHPSTNPLDDGYNIVSEKEKKKHIAFLDAEIIILCPNCKYPNGFQKIRFNEDDFILFQRIWYADKSQFEILFMQPHWLQSLVRGHSFLIFFLFERRKQKWSMTSGWPFFSLNSRQFLLLHVYYIAEWIKLRNSPSFDYFMKINRKQWLLTVRPILNVIEQ